MQAMQRIPKIRAFNDSTSFSYIPTAVFIGGTSGIGQGLAEAFARRTKGNSHIILVGRNKAAAESIISTFPKPSPFPDLSAETDAAKPTHEFLYCDATLMRNVTSASEQLRQLAPSINFLVMCPGFTTLGWDETKEEGLDKRMALHYYARWKFIQELMPALNKAKENGKDAKVLTTLTTNRNGPKLDLNDLGLKNSKPSSTSIITTIYNDLMIDLTVHPTGILNTGTRHSSSHNHFCTRIPRLGTYKHRLIIPSSIVRIASRPIQGILRPWMTPKEDAGEFLLHGLIHTAYKPERNWRLDEFGEEMSEKHGYAEDFISRKKLWEHTEAVMGMTA
ncbi:hypothetical protein D9757_012267 [Collybiopsis confluens]|uniref:NAD(P)-binding protein n=1 Tax=Collybiopsis confluens TaxID=2823264 RepID=A0A8H5G5G2_9AGAR|nr:hypothetical protein D9757_012267 [Collybiopsis confluens]